MTTEIIIFVFLLVTMLLSGFSLWLTSKQAISTDGLRLCASSFFVLAFGSLVSMSSVFAEYGGALSEELTVTLRYLRALLVPISAVMFTHGISKHLLAKPLPAKVIQGTYTLVWLSVTVSFLFDQPYGWPTVLVNSWIGLLALVSAYFALSTKLNRLTNSFLTSSLFALSGFSITRSILAASNIQSDPNTIYDFALLSGASLASIAVSFALIVGVSHTTSRQYRKLAHHDSLTHVLNRRGFTVEATQLANKDPDNFSALIFIDLNRFKHINDQFGHAHGDRVLRDFSILAQSVIPKKSVFGRLSGDEFAVYIKGYSISQAHRLMDQLSAEVARAFDFYKLSFSWGLAFTQSHDVNIESLMNEADAAMYRRKLQDTTISAVTKASRPTVG